MFNKNAKFSFGHCSDKVKSRVTCTAVICKEIDELTCKLYSNHLKHGTTYKS